MSDRFPIHVFLRVDTAAGKRLELEDVYPT